MKPIFFLLLLLCTICDAKTDILTPTFSKRETAVITLDNGLQALLVSDPNLDQSGGLLTVQKGSWDEPKEYPGLAHFLEHMLFLGTKKYPNEGEYQRTISHYNGIANAFTSSTYTAYMFTVDNSAFTEVLDRFAYFFREPLFNPSGVSREIQAIDQEYAKNLENDDFREYFVYKELSSPDHPEHLFNIGNSKTLKDVSQATLKDWYQKNYSSNLMRLIVYSTLPLDKLKAQVIEDFSPVVNKNVTPSTFEQPTMTEQLIGKMIYVQPIKNVRTLTITWELPPKFADMNDTQPTQIVSYVLGHEGKESLLAQLKREKLAEGLSSGSSRRGNATVLFEVSIKLTDEGVDHIYDVVSRVFQTIAMLKQKGIPQEIFDEMQQIAKIGFQYQQREPLFDVLNKDAYFLPHFDLNLYPEQAYIVQKYDAASISEIINSLTPDKAAYYLMAPPTVTGVKLDKQEEWLGVPYTVRPIPANWMKSWTQINAGNDKIALPAPNPFVPKNLVLANEIKQSSELPLVPTPQKLVDDDSGILYFAPDQRYGVPSVSWFFELKTPQIDAGKPAKVVLTDLVIKAVKESLNKQSYEADVAGLKYDITRSDFGIQIQIEGYSEHAPKLFSEIVRRLKELHPTEEKFKIYKQSLLREYQNADKDMPIKQAFEIMKSALYRWFTTSKQKASALRRVNFEKFNEYTSELFNQCYIQAVVYGNMTESDAQSLWSQLKQEIGGATFPKSDQKKVEVVVLPEKGGPYYIETTSRTQGNAVVLAIEGDGYSLEKRAAQQILNQITEQSFFEELRTRQQTGYIVYSWAEELERQLFQYFAVQSNSHGVNDLLARYELFFESFLQELVHDVDQETFSHIKTAVLTQLETPQKSMAEMTKLLQTLAFKYDGDFDWINKRIDALKNLSYERFLEITRESLGRTNHRKLAILLKGVTPNQNPSYQRLGNVEQLRRVSTYANGLDKMDKINSISKN